MAGPEGFGSFRHLAQRFFGALSPAGPPEPEERWALGFLVPGEADLWHRMSGPDRRHAIGVARDTLEVLADSPPRREVAAAALLHDVGKVEAGLGTFARVGVTLAAMALGRDKLLAWAERAEVEAGKGLRSRVANYLAHDSVGAVLLQKAGSDPLTVSWARQHHLSPERWSIDAEIGSALKAADGD